TGVEPVPAWTRTGWSVPARGEPGRTTHLRTVYRNRYACGMVCRTVLPWLSAALTRSPTVPDVADRAGWVILTSYTPSPTRVTGTAAQVWPSSKLTSACRSVTTGGLSSRSW